MVSAQLSGTGAAITVYNAKSGWPYPGQQLRDPVHGVVGNAADDLAQIGFRVEPIKFRRLDQRRHQCGALAAGIGARECPVVPAPLRRGSRLPPQTATSPTRITRP